MCCAHLLESLEAERPIGVHWSYDNKDGWFTALCDACEELFQTSGGPLSDLGIESVVICEFCLEDVLRLNGKTGLH